MYCITNTYLKGKFGQDILKTLNQITSKFIYKQLVQTVSEIHLCRSIIGLFLISFAEARGIPFKTNQIETSKEAFPPLTAIAELLSKAL